MSILKELMAINEDKKVVELTNFTGKRIPSEAWTEGVLYRGFNVYKLVYDGPEEATLAGAMGGVKDRFDGSLEFQESYLGYSPSKDVFILGHDGWATTEDTNYDYDSDDEDSGDETEDVDFNVSPYCIFKISDKGNISIVDKGSDFSDSEQMWYGKHGGLKAAHSKWSDLIDIRLD